MTPRKLAQFYLRYWSNGQFASNAPLEIRKLLASLNETELRDVHDALQYVATGQAPALPPDETLLMWLATHPAYAIHGDELLTDRKAPKNMVTLLRNIHSSAHRHLRNKVQAWLQTEIEKFQS